MGAEENGRLKEEKMFIGEGGEMRGEKEGGRHCPCTHQMTVVAEAAGSVSVSELLPLVKMSVRLCLLSVCLDVCLLLTGFCLSVHLSACLPVYFLSVCLSICLSDTDLLQIFQLQHEL